MTVVVAMSFANGAVVASDTQRIDGVQIGSTRFPKTLRRDWDHALAQNAISRLVIGGIAGQMFHGHQRLTSLIEAECSNVATLPQLVLHLCAQLDQWIAPGNGIDVVLAATENLDQQGQPQIVHLRSAGGQCQPVHLQNPNICVVGSGAAAAQLALLNANLANVEAAAAHAVQAAIQAGNNGCGGHVSLQRWP